jgi:NADH-quinone oxidoreductase subunit F
MHDIDLSPLQSVLNRYGSQGRTALLPALQATQEIYGYIPEPAAASIAAVLHVPLAEVYGVINFYSLLNSKPASEMVVHVCGDPACANAGADGVLKRLTKEVKLHTDGIHSITVERSHCLGLCEHAPAMMVKGASFSHIGGENLEELFVKKAQRPRTIVGGDIHLLTSNCGLNKVIGLLEYEQSGGYTALKKALHTTPDHVIESIKNAGLVGRGGAAFPTGDKWEGAAKAPGNPKYVICNADEAEPGTFKDRVLLEDDPHRILEGLILAGYAIGAHYGYIYIRGEYLYGFESMSHAVEEARQNGYLGLNILGSEFTFDVEIRRGAGAYVCGEETALFESIEGKRGLPRIKPPFPTTFGLFGKPTIINNVETLVNIPLIVTLGADGYRKFGTPKSPGSKLFSVSGDVKHPGVYEVPFGIPLRHLIFDLAGGLRETHKLQAVLMGGAAGAFATQKDLDVNLSYEDLRSAGLPLGSGSITVFDETRDMGDVLMRLTRFFAEESCGKCFPCQIGTQRQYEILRRVAKHQPLPGDQERLEDLAYTMTDASICGLGQTASSAVMSAIRLWQQLFITVS